MLKALHEQHPWKSINRFMPFALKKGFTETEVKKFFKDNVVRDERAIDNSKYYLPIYSRAEGAYQFDTLIQSRGASPPAFLIFINVNSRKAYAYPMLNKGKNEVLKALTNFVSNVKVNELTSDQDSAYLNDDVIDFLNDNDIDYHTTEDNNHNVLGIINRFMRTLRDLNGSERDISSERMKKLIKTYNNTYHSALSKSPNEFDVNDEKEYISKMTTLTDSITSKPDFVFNRGDKVRVILEKKGIGKRRSNLSPECYVVDSLEGYGYNIRAKDDSVAFYPRHRLVKANSNVKVGETLNDGKRGIVSRILSYDAKSDKYKVVYEGGVEDWIKAKNMRETNPTRLSRMEVEFWKGMDNVPPLIMKYKGLK